MKHSETPPVKHSSALPLARVTLRSLILLNWLVGGLIFAMLAVSFLAYKILERVTGLTMELSLLLALSVLGVTAAMCVISGLLAVSKLIAADPADLF